MRSPRDGLLVSFASWVIQSTIYHLTPDCRSWFRKLLRFSLPGAAPLRITGQWPTRTTQLPCRNLIEEGQYDSYREDRRDTIVTDVTANPNFAHPCPPASRRRSPAVRSRQCVSCTWLSNWNTSHTYANDLKTCSVSLGLDVGDASFDVVLPEGDAYAHFSRCHSRSASLVWSI